MNVCFIMYPWDQIDPENDSTLALIQDFELTPSSPELMFIENTAGSYQTGNGLTK